MTHVDFAIAFDKLEQDFIALIDSLGSSRELNCAKTRLEEATLWVAKHIAVVELADANG